MGFTLCDAHLVDAALDIARGDITVDGMRIQEIGYPGHSPGERENIIDATDMLVIAGFIDVHTQGGGGYNLHTTSAGAIRAYAGGASGTGVSSLVTAVVD